MLALWLILGLVAFTAAVKDEKMRSSKSRNKNKQFFLLQDRKDGLCLSGSYYQRCGSDTLWYVSGPTGAYSLHHKSASAANETKDSDYCLSRTECISPTVPSSANANTSPNVQRSSSNNQEETKEEVDLAIGMCNECGSNSGTWDIMGDALSGYVLVQNGVNCLKREGSRANQTVLVHCNVGYSSFSLHFIQPPEIVTMDSLGAKMISAAEKNAMGEVVDFIEKQAVDVNSLDWNDQTALIAAASKGNIDILDYLINKGADISMTDREQVSAFMEAANGGHLEIVHKLAKLGAEIDGTASSGVTALWLASASGQSQVVDYLLSYDKIEGGLPANVNAMKSDGVTALMVAALEGHEACVQLLLNAGADANTKDNEGITAITSAAEKGYTNIVKMLLSHKVDLDSFTQTDFSPLILASAHGHDEVVDLLLKGGATADLPNSDNVTAIMYAASGGFSKVVEALIKAKADVNRVHSNGGSALFEAATNGSETVVNLLLQAKADPFVLDTDKVTTLMTAASQGHTAVCKILVKKGVPINTIASSGGSALMFAAVGGYTDTAKFLLDNGADVELQVNATNQYKIRMAAELQEKASSSADGGDGVEPHKDGLNVLMLAAQQGHLGVVQLLIEKVPQNQLHILFSHHDEDDLSALWHAIRGKYTEIALLLLKHGAPANDDIISVRASGFTSEQNLLMTAVLEEHEELALSLITNGANVHYSHSSDKGGDDATIITQAAYFGMDAVVKALLEKGADATMVNEEGAGPLLAASVGGHGSIVKMLLEDAKVNPNQQDIDGTTALMTASIRGHKAIVLDLIKAGAQLNAQNMEGHSALMFAYNGMVQVEHLTEKYKEYMEVNVDSHTKKLEQSLSEHSFIVNTLISNGADPLMKDRENHRATDFSSR